MDNLPGKDSVGPIEMISLSIGLAYSVLIGTGVAFIINYLCCKISASVYTWISLFVGLTAFSFLWKFYYLPRLKKIKSLK
jgi:hypothetical protein